MLIYFNFNLALQTKLLRYPGAGGGGGEGGRKGGKELWHKKDGVDGQEPLHVRGTKILFCGPDLQLLLGKGIICCVL